MHITDLTEVTAQFDHPGYLQLYLQRFQEAFSQGRFDAIPGKEQTLRCGRHRLDFLSYAILDDERFRRWHKETVAQVLDFRHDEGKVATRETYAGCTPEMFALLAAKARQLQGNDTGKDPGKESGEKPARGKASPAQVLPATPTGASTETTGDQSDERQSA